MAVRFAVNHLGCKKRWDEHPVPVPLSQCRISASLQSMSTCVPKLTGLVISGVTHFLGGSEILNVPPNQFSLSSLSSDFQEESHMNITPPRKG